MSLFGTNVHRFVASTRLMLSLALLIGLIAAARPQPAAAATTFTVNTTADAVDLVSGDGHCDTVPAGPGFPAGDQCTLRAAIMEANALAGDDTIILPAGVYKITRAGALKSSGTTGDFNIKSALVIQGVSPSKTIVDAQDLDRAFHIQAPNAVVELKHLTIRNGHAGHGGGVYAISTRLRLTNTWINGNTADGYGGGLNVSQGTLALIDSRVLNNEAGMIGGGMTLDGPTATLRGTTIRGNKAGNTGGGISQSGKLTLTNSTISGNSATGGGGGIITTGTVIVQQSTLSGNKLTGKTNGGAISVGLNAKIALDRVTISANHAIRGGGIHNPGAASNLTIKRSIIAENTGAFGGPDCEGKFVSEGHNLLGSASGCTVEGDMTGNLIGVEADLLALANNGGTTQTHALRGDSPALDAGPAGGCGAKDQRGQARPVDGNGDGTAHCDIGAYEYNGPIVTKLNPGSRPAGGGNFTLTITGKNFSSKSVVLWKGQTRPKQFVSSTKITVQIAAGDIATAGKATVRVQTPGATLDSGLSNGKTFTITK